MVTVGSYRYMHVCDIPLAMGAFIGSTLSMAFRVYLASPYRTIHVDNSSLVPRPTMTQVFIAYSMNTTTGGVVFIL